MEGSQSVLKRQQFHKQIRQRHHQQIFKKIRHENRQQHHELDQQSIVHNEEYQKLIKRIPEMYQISDRIQQIVDNSPTIANFITQMRKFEDTQQLFKIPPDHNFNPHSYINHGFSPFLTYMLHLSTIIHKHISMDIEPQAQLSSEFNSYSEQAYQERQTPFAQILLPISYCLINVTSFDGLSLPYLKLIAEFVRHRVYIDCFHNLFLADNLDNDTMIKLFSQYLVHLQQNPMLYLNNSPIFTKILYYALCQPSYTSRMTTQMTSNGMVKKRVQKFENRIIKLVDKMHSIISFATNLNDREKKQFYTTSFNILQRLCMKNSPNSWQVINRDNLIKSVITTLQNFRSCLLSKGKLQQDHTLTDTISCLKLLSNILYFDQIASCISTQYPTLWLHLHSIFQRLSHKFIFNSYNSSFSSVIIEQSKQPKLPSIYCHSQFCQVVEKILKCMANFVCVPEVCECFVGIGEGGDRGQGLIWVDLLTDIYEQYYKYQNIRLQCLCIFSNCLILHSKNHKNNPSPSLPRLLLNCQILLMQCLKLTNQHKQILITVLKTLRLLLQDEAIQNQQHQHQTYEQNKIRNSLIFKDHSFINRLHAIAEIDVDSELGGVRSKGFGEMYTDDVRMEAQFLIECLAIGV